MNTGLRIAAFAGPRGPSTAEDLSKATTEAMSSLRP